MKRVLVASFLVACASGHAMEHSPAIASTSPTTPPAPHALKLSFPALDIFGGQEPSTEHTQGTLIMAVSDERGRRLDELDIATMQVVRTLEFRQAELYALQKHDDALYVVTKQGGVKSDATYTLLRVDLGSLKIAKSAPAAEAPPLSGTDYAFPPFVSVGSRGVRVVYRGRCPTSVPEGEMRDGDCTYYETHRLGDLGVLKVHMVPMLNKYSESPVRVPDDYGELPEAKRDERDPHCTTSAARFVDSVWVGDNYFELRAGCCDEHNGGFFQCKASK